MALGGLKSGLSNIMVIASCFSDMCNNSFDLICLFVVLPPVDNVTSLRIKGRFINYAWREAGF